ncbi:hypothetical protein K435DRAFT_464695 [Dendrothele bispora CBS 962.96]|uniref:Uncharacterized protein n=1 Tax=Dendrothele bispora (strain CBS 962.96) TaxID=1314807 RepID=A0A4S8L0R5_DENBC|nr:hypothetical protein K435DRAFT_464695 [Dendrothele bispora CBS 962.96]
MSSFSTGYRPGTRKLDTRNNTNTLLTGNTPLTILMDDGLTQITRFYLSALKSFRDGSDGVLEAVLVRMWRVVSGGRQGVGVWSFSIGKILRAVITAYKQHQ